MTLKELQIGKSAVVDTVGGTGALRQHFLDMGLVPGAQVTLIKLAPMGDPMELRIHGYELTLRLDDAAQIGIIPTEKVPAAPALVDDKMVDHPGLGEGGKYHIKKGEHPLPDGTTLTFALAGNQNCGKTTLFNQLTGSNQHVGNFPGVTVDRKSGAIKGHPETEVTDLPGIYSMSPYSSEEIVTRQFIIGEKPTGIINIVDATNIERNLYLTMQLMELDIPMVLALNMMDEMRGNGGTVRINKMEAMLGIPVIPISAAKNEGVDELVDHAVHVAKYQERPGRMDFCSEDDHGGAVHRCIHGILHLIEDHAKAAGIPVRFAATKLVEGDPRIEEALKLDPNEKEMIEHIIVQMERERGLDRAAAIADMRFSFIQELVAQTVVKPHESKEQLRSNRIDKFLTGKYTAIPAFIAIMGLVFFLTFNVIGLFFQNLMETGITALTGLVDTALTNWNVNAAVHSLVIDGIFTGVGSVLSFLPIIVVLFFFLSMLEDTGYMARVAFVMDKLLRRIGLSGRSIVPMLIGFGCTVPFVMELPNYRLPGLKNVAQLLWEKARDFLQKAFTVIFAATIVIWFLQNFDLQLRLTADPQASILARIAGDIAPLFAPLGFADWRVSTALITGFMAKESVVSTLIILFGSEAALAVALTPAQAAPLLVFCLLYTPCIAAVAAVKRELGNKWAVIMVVNQCAVAWICALLVRFAAVMIF